MDRFTLGRSIILKSLFVGLYLAVEGMLLQVAKSRWIFRSPAPTIGFVAEVALLYVATGILFALVYFYLKDQIPGATRAAKGFNYALLVIAGVAVAGTLAVIGLDFEGGFRLLTDVKVQDYAIALTDSLNFAITGIVLGLIAEPRNPTPVAYRPRRRLLPCSILGFFLLPIASAALCKAIAAVLPLGLGVPAEAEPWFYVGTFVPLAIPGTAIPLFYDIARARFDGSAIQRAGGFFALFFGALQLIDLVFGLPFGLSIQAVVDFVLSLGLPMYALILFTAVTLGPTQAPL